MKECIFNKAIDLSEILGKYGFNMDSIGNIQVGDGIEWFYTRADGTFVTGYYKTNG